MENEDLKPTPIIQNLALGPEQWEIDQKKAEIARSLLNGLSLDDVTSSLKDKNSQTDSYEIPFLQ